MLDTCIIKDYEIKCSNNTVEFVDKNVFMINNLRSSAIMFQTDSSINIVCPGTRFQELTWGKDKAVLWLFPDFLNNKKIPCICTDYSITYLYDNVYLIGHESLQERLAKDHILRYYSSFVRLLLEPDSPLFIVPSLEPEYSILTMVSYGGGKLLCSAAMRNFLKLFISDADIIDRLSDLLVSGFLSPYIILSILKGIIGYEKLNVFVSGNELFIETEEFDLIYKKYGKGREIIIHDH